MHADLFYQTHANADKKQVIPLFLINKEQWEKGLSEFDGHESNAFITQQFKGKAGDLCLICNKEGLLHKVYLGAGNNNFNSAMAQAANHLPPGYYNLQQSVPASALIKWSLAQYRFDKYKHHDITPKILVMDEKELKAINDEAKAIFLVRELINMPTNDMGPEQLSLAAGKIADEFGADFTQWIGEQLLSSNFPAIHAVGRAAATAPRLIHLSWGNPAHPTIAIIGKGVCFDSGGLDIKPSSAMRLMKKDMGGAAHALGLAQLLMASGLPVNLHVWIPAVENAIGPDSFRPGDILTMRNGLTVEIDNTDAEGRLVLADAMVKACEDSPELIIDFATLTGAARVAVGTDIAAMFTNNDSLATQINKASEETGDPVWRLPLFAGYESMLDSTVADLVNATPSPYAGAITAALFLKRFIPDNIPWMHFDIMAWNVSSKPGKPEGGEAMAIRALAYYLNKKYGN